MESKRPLGQIAIAARAFLQPHWEEWHATWAPPAPTTLSQWTCVRSATFLAFALEHAGFQARVESGRPRPEVDVNAFGFLTKGRWESHAWVICGDKIIDITADQFGQPEIMILLASDGRYRAGHDAETTLPITEKGAVAVQKLKALWTERILRPHLP